VRTTDQIRIGGYTLAIEDVELEAMQDRPLAPFLPRDRIEADLLRAMGEGELSSREVYADWLEEHGHAPEAEFVRVQQALVAMAPEDDDFGHARRGCASSRRRSTSVGARASRGR
jgi:uncharacterized protein (TIGR02996 family)